MLGNPARVAARAALSRPGHRLAVAYSYGVRRMPVGTFYMVSQNQSFQEERDLGILFAPTTTKAGHPALPHWRTMEELTPDDVVLCAFRQRVVSVAVPRGGSVVDMRPPELPPAPWAAEGWVCEVEYHDLAEPIHLYDEVPLEWRLGEARFDVDGDVKQQYLLELSGAFAGHFMATFGDRIPESVLDPEAERGVAPTPPKAASSVKTALEDASKSGTRRKPVTRTIEVSLRHGQLVKEFGDYIEDAYGTRPSAGKYRIPVSGAALRSDVFLDDRDAILEAKPELTVTEMYGAIGQLVIYPELEDRTVNRRAVLVGEEPDGWYLTMLAKAGIDCVWQTETGFADNAGGFYL